MKTVAIEIQLTKGYVTVVDDEDGDLQELRWNSLIVRTGLVYARRERCYMHRVVLSRILGAELTRTQQVDHINGDGLCNLRSNLRIATVAQNQRNRLTQSNNTSGVVGVNWNKQARKWHARIKVHGKSLFLGSFDSLVDAGIVRKEAEIRHFGEFSAVLSRKEMS